MYSKKSITTNWRTHATHVNAIISNRLHSVVFMLNTSEADITIVLMVSLYGVCSDVEARDSLTADEDEAAADDDNDAGSDGDIDTDDQSSDDEDAGDIDELLDEALDKDTEESSVHADDKPLLTKDSAATAAAKPVSYSYCFTVTRCRLTFYLIALQNA